MNEKQQQLTFDKGITNVPSDALCSDNALEESLGMIYENGEHRVIQKPADTNLNISDKILYIHQFNDNKRIIALNITEVQGVLTYKLKWYTEGGVGGADLLTTSPDAKVTSIGKTLVVSDSSGMHCFLWKDQGGQHSYDSIMYPFPEIGMNVCLNASPTGYFAGNSSKSEGITAWDSGEQRAKVAQGEQGPYNDMIIGLYAQNLKNIANKKGFAKPFMVRMALELYDGSYTYITNPVPLFPCITKSTCGFFYGGSIEEAPNAALYLRTHYAKLMVKQTTDYSAYHDIVRDVVLFVTRGVDIYNRSTDQPLDYLGQGDAIVVGDSVVSTASDPLAMRSKYQEFKSRENSGDAPNNIVYGCLSSRNVADIKNDLINDTIFYKLCSLGLKPISSFVDVGTLTPDYVFENITTQEQLGDDYFSRNNLKSGLLYAYNSRLNLANVSRGVFKGYGFFMPLDRDSGDYYYDFYVKIKLDTKSVWVALLDCQTIQKQGIFFFYPDSRAEHVTIYRRTTFGGQRECVCDEVLKESESLNGAYYFKGLPSSTTDETTVTPGSDAFIIGTTQYDNNAAELLPNYVIQSEVNNPFVFKAAGYFKVGTGKIIGMSSITQALSEGQFGQFPLLVFSESGIWALTVADTGYYNSVHPMSREVALLDNPCITQTDGAVFFASEKGLMVVVGNVVKCVSEQLSGRSGEPFVEYLHDAVIAYDYRDSLLWIFTNNGTNAWVYSIKSGTFGRYKLSTEGTPVSITVVNNYPDYLIQNGTTVYSLTNRQDINLDTGTYDGTIITRPMKLENALALKSLMQIRHILQFTPYTVTESHEDPETHETVTTTTTQKGSMTLRIFASNNLYNWVELHSLRGTPWKYYKFRFDFTNMKATDRFAGTVLITQERRTNKLR